MHLADPSPNPVMQSDHHQALGRLYTAHQGWLYGQLHRQLGCAHKAEDLLHDTFLKVLLSRALPVLQEPRAFLNTVAHGLVVNHWRRLALERAYLAALAEQAPGHHPSPEDRAQAIDALCQIDSLLAGLSDRARQAFLLAQLDGLAYAEIAAQLGVSERMVKKYMAQAMLLLLQADV